MSGAVAGASGPSAQFRFYEELNDFLPAPRRRQSFTARCARGATVKQAIEALGVPHTEVEVVLLNGVSVGFAEAVSEGDRVSVYPKFEALDVRPLLRVRPAPLRVVRLLADAHFGALARRLRLLGFDTRFAGDLDDASIAELARREERVILTRDRELLKRRAVTHGCYLRAETVAGQVREVIDRLDLRRDLAAFTRCIECNSALLPVGADVVAGRVPEDVRRGQREFVECPRCERVYWRGAHYRALARWIDEVVGERA